MSKTETWNEENKGNSWTDEELAVVLSDAPTEVNSLKHARAFRRGIGSIKQIYQWASTAKKVIKAKRGDDKFVNQVKRVSKEVGWIL